MDDLTFRSELRREQRVQVLEMPDYHFPCRVSFLLIDTGELCTVMEVKVQLYSYVTSLQLGGMGLCSRVRLFTVTSEMSQSLQQLLFHDVIS